MNTHPQIEVMYSEAVRKVERGGKSAEVVFRVRTGALSEQNLRVTVRRTKIGVRGTWDLTWSSISKKDAIQVMREHDWYMANS